METMAHDFMAEQPVHSNPPSSSLYISTSLHLYISTSLHLYISTSLHLYMPTTKKKHNTNTAPPDAHAYHLPHLLHNKPDNTAIHILQMHLPALRHNPASRLYIEDKILPEKTPFDKKPQDEVENTAALHLSLIATLGTRGRREKHWRWLVDQAGMEVCEILYGDGSGWGNGDRVVVVRRREQDGWR
jgi:hypothetical protein